MPGRKGFALRLPPEVYAAVRRWAEDDLRSINGQIEFLLVDALRKAGRWPPPTERPGGEDGDEDRGGGDETDEPKIGNEPG
ncbi:MAG: Arc family DNA-binding protein [Acidobacteriota bacterium]